MTAKKEHLQSIESLYRSLYRDLFHFYGPQGWWPLESERNTPGFTEDGYHPGIFSLPSAAKQRFEVALGTVLTQNTAWRNVAPVVRALILNEISSPGVILDTDASLIKKIIRPCGYYNQKYRKLCELSRFFLQENNLDTGIPPSREALLSVWGIGPETADSILLYAFGAPRFVVDAYTLRILSRVAGDEYAPWTYARVQRDVECSFPENRNIYQELHGLLVFHAKRFCRKTPVCTGCTLSSMCRGFHKP